MIKIIWAEYSREMKMIYKNSIEMKKSNNKN